MNARERLATTLIREMYLRASRATSTGPKAMPESLGFSQYTRAFTLSEVNHIWKKCFIGFLIIFGFFNFLYLKKSEEYTNRKDITPSDQELCFCCCFFILMFCRYYPLEMIAQLTHKIHKIFKNRGNNRWNHK